MKTIIEKLKHMIRDDRVKGCRCPVCGKYVKEYKRYMRQSMIKALCIFATWYRYNDKKLETWIHFEDFITGLNTVPKVRGDFAKLKYWGLIEVGSTPGYYRLTTKGWDFLVNSLRVEEYVIVYEDKPIRYSDKLVTLVECLGKSFTYEEYSNFRVNLITKKY